MKVLFSERLLGQADQGVLKLIVVLAILVDEDERSFKASSIGTRKRQWV
jgi:hypothetical protein